MLCVDLNILYWKPSKKFPQLPSAAPLPFPILNHTISPGSSNASFLCPSLFPDLPPHGSIDPSSGPSPPPRCLRDKHFCSTLFPSQRTDLHIIFTPLFTCLCLWSVLPLVASPTRHSLPHRTPAVPGRTASAGSWHSSVLSLWKFSPVTRPSPSLFTFSLAKA